MILTGSWDPHELPKQRFYRSWTELCCLGLSSASLSSRVVEEASEVEVSDSRAASELYLQATAGKGR